MDKLEFFMPIITDVTWRFISALLAAVGITGVGVRELSKKKTIPISHLCVLFVLVLTLMMVLLNQMNYALVETKSRGVLRPTVDQVILWLTDSGLAVKKIPDDKANWRLMVSHPRNGTRIKIENPKDNPNIMLFDGNIKLTGDQLKRYLALTKTEQNAMMYELLIRLHSIGIASDIPEPEDTNPRIGIERVLVYDEPITKRDTVEISQKMLLAVGLVVASIQSSVGGIPDTALEMH